MSLNSAKNKISFRPSGGFRTTDKFAGAATINTAVIAKGATTFLVASGTGVTAGKVFRLGVGENMELVTITSLATLTVTPARPLMRAHVAGEAFVEALVTDLGRLGGVAQANFNDNATDFEVEDRRLLYSKLPGVFDLEMSVSIVGITPYTIATALGIPFANVFGSGTHTAPFCVQTDGTEVGTEVNQCVVIQGTTMDGSPITIELWGCDADYTGVSIPMSRGAGLVIPCKWAGAMMCIDTNALTYTGDTTNTSIRGDLLAQITDIGVFEAATTGPLATTLSALAAVGAQTVSLTAVTNLVADDFLQIGIDTAMEVHRVNNPATTTLVTKLYRAFASGATAIRLKQTSLGGILKGSVKVDVGGSVDKIQLENVNATIGLKAGAATVALSFSIVDFIASVIARALAVPQSEAAGGRFTTENAGTSPIAAMYLAGKNVTGNTVLIVITGCSQAISNTALQLQKKGVTGIPFSVSPGSVMQLTVYS